jgi:hypothetical protein
LILYCVPILMLGGGYILAAPQLATALACILLCFPLTRRAPATRKSAIRDSMVAGVFITLLACVLLLPGGFLAFLPLAFIWVGLVWGWISGGLLWRFFQQALLPLPSSSSRLVNGCTTDLFGCPDGDASEIRPTSFSSRSYTRGIRHLVDIGAPAEKEVIQ